MGNCLDNKVSGEVDNSGISKNSPWNLQVNFSSDTSFNTSS